MYLIDFAVNQNTNLISESFINIINFSIILLKYNFTPMLKRNSATFLNTYCTEHFFDWLRSAHFPRSASHRGRVWI